MGNLLAYFYLGLMLYFGDEILANKTAGSIYILISFLPSLFNFFREYIMNISMKFKVNLVLSFPFRIWLHFLLKNEKFAKKMKFSVIIPKIVYRLYDSFNYLFYLYLSLLLY